jgi:iron complex transport system substrate-binding protein
VRASTEMLIARAPEVVVELHYNVEIEESRRDEERALWQRLGAIPAVRGKRIHLLFGDHLVVPGPRLVRAVEEFARAIHPEAF